MATRQPSGMTRRRPRIPDAESERRMLAAGKELITEQGMTVSLEHISLEEIITKAGVSRSSVYRRWPYREDYFADLLLAVASTPMLFPESEETLGKLLAVVSENPDAFHSETNRRAFIVDGLRISMQASFEQLCASREWRTYLALHATYQGLPDGELRTRVGAALAEREQAYAAHRAEVYGALLDIIGYRLVPPLTREAGLLSLAVATGALMTGFVIEAGTRPEMITETTQMAAFGGPDRAWSGPAYALGALFLSMVEPDPEVVWNAERIEFALTGVQERMEAARRVRAQQAE